jgi:hypothetical protein
MDRFIYLISSYLILFLVYNTLIILTIKFNMPLGGDISTIDVDNDAILLVVVLEVK